MTAIHSDSGSCFIYIYFKRISTSEGHNRGPFVIMFCLRSWLPLLFIPTSASPAFIVMFLISTYFFHRPCVYCSLLMLTLFTSSCYWSDRCFLDSNNGHWFEPRILTTATAAFNTAAGSISSHAGDPALGNATDTMGVWTGIGLDWLRSLVGRREWRLPCVDVNVRL
ncbi:bladder cancer-related protein BC10-domain-containing protein [Terfezia claveryi]|nr:bladder cancer-related protein BC10-domain-containing protein [Terfezia claveryi]